RLRKNIAPRNHQPGDQRKCAGYRNPASSTNRRRGWRRWVVLIRPHPSVTSSRNCFDVTLSSEAVVERLAEDGNISRQSTFLDMNAGPDELHQLVLFHHASIAADQREEGIDSFRRERDYLAVAREQPVAGIDPEQAKLVRTRRCIITHDSPGRKLPGLYQSFKMPRNRGWIRERR